MKKSENGFGVIEVLVAIILIGLIITVGWLVYDRQNSSEKANSTKSFKKSSQSKKKNKVDTSVHDVDISLVSEADLEKLPAYTPESFRSHMARELKNNTQGKYEGQYDCITKYTVSKISQLNISGGSRAINGPTASAESDCIGAAPAIWVLNSSGTWEQVSLNGQPCETESGALIYSEFMPECYNTQTDSYYANPNGSVVSASKKL